MNIQSQIYKSDPPRFNMVGQKLTQTIQLVDGEISQGMLKRIVSYANKEISEYGFEKFTENSDISVYTIDNNKVYTVRWTNSKGGYIELTGIHTSKGWPHLNYGFNIGTD